MPSVSKVRPQVPVNMADEKEHRRKIAEQANAGIPVLKEWIPALKFGGMSTGITYSSVIGRSCTWAGVVHEVWLYLALTDKGSATGSATIEGLEFENNSGIDVISGDFALQNASGNLSGLKCEVKDGEGVLRLYHSHGASSGPKDILDDSDFTDDSIIEAHIIYRVI